MKTLVAGSSGLFGLEVREHSPSTLVKWGIRKSLEQTISEIARAMRRRHD
jgi:hypothetical protein